MWALSTPRVLLGVGSNWEWSHLVTNCNESYRMSFLASEPEFHDIAQVIRRQERSFFLFFSFSFVEMMTYAIPIMLVIKPYDGVSILST